MFHVWKRTWGVCQRLPDFTPSFFILVFSGNEASRCGLLEEQQQPYNHFQSKSKVPLLSKKNATGCQLQIQSEPRKSINPTGSRPFYWCCEIHHLYRTSSHPHISTSVSSLHQQTIYLRQILDFTLLDDRWVSCDSTSFCPPVFGFFLLIKEKLKPAAFSLCCCLYQPLLLQQVNRKTPAVVLQHSQHSIPESHRFHFKLIGKKLLQQWRTPKRGFLLLLFL